MPRFTSRLPLDVHVWTCKLPSTRKFFPPGFLLVCYFYPTYFTFPRVGKHRPCLVLQRIRLSGWLSGGKHDYFKSIHVLLNWSLRSTHMLDPNALFSLSQDKTRCQFIRESDCVIVLAFLLPGSNFASFGIRKRQSKCTYLHLRKRLTANV